ncbi:MAG: hypothetical protein ACLQBA_26260 [Candidatus Binataceae bacterium]
MSEFNKFCNELRVKIDEADKHLKDLKASAKNAGQKAKDDAKAHLIELENKAKAQQAQIKASEAKAKAWIEEKKTVTSEKIAEWKAQRQVKKLADYADSAGGYASVARDIAAAAVDEAARATVEALVARNDADAAQAADRSKAG